MFGLFGMVFLVAISLTSESHGLALEIAENSEVLSMMETLFENYDYLDSCHDTLSWSMNVTACEQLMGGLVDLKEFLFTSVEAALTLVDEAETLKTEFTTCSTESIFKQIKCYTSVISSAKALEKEAKTDEEEFTEDGEAIVKQIKVNFANCFQKGFSNKRVESKMRLCKLKLKLKSN